MRALLGVLRVAAVDLRGGLRRFLVLLLCLALGTGTIAAVGSVGGALQAAVARDARTFLGGDLEAQLSYRPASEPERAALDRWGTVSEVVELSARASTVDGAAFLALRAANGNFPLLGEIVLDPPMSPAAALAPAGGNFGAAVDARLLDRLGLALGDTFTIGNATLVARAQLDSMPDDAARGFQLGIPVLVSTDALRAAGILGEGVLVRYRYKLLLDDGVDPAEAKAAVEAALAGAGWQVREPADAATGLRRFFDLFSRFLVLIGLSTLIVGGVGVANAVTAYLDTRQDAIATLRSLGASGRRVLVHFLFQVLLLSAAGVILGLLLGAGASVLLLPFIGGLLELNLAPMVDWGALGIAAGFGLAIALCFSILPLAQARRVPPALLFRSGAVAETGWWRELRRPGVAGSLLLAIGLVLGLAVITSGRPIFVLYYAAALAGGFLLLRSAAALLGILLRLVPSPAALPARLAVGGLRRNRSVMATVVTSLGVGLTLLLLVALIEGNLRRELDGQIVSEAPGFIFYNIDRTTLPELQQFAEANPRVENFEAVPVTRGVVSKVGDTPSSELGELPPEVAPLFRGDQALSWSRELPEGSELSEGDWWAADYEGKPLVSPVEALRDALGLRVGDTLEVTVAGRRLTATVSSFRRVDERRPGADFPLVFSPGLIERAPGTWLATLKTAAGEEAPVERELARTFPNLAFAPVGEALERVAELVGSLSTAVATVGGVAVVSGMLVLAGALSAGRQRREAEAVIYKVLGATRRTVLFAYLVEYGLLGALATLLASLLGTAGAWAVVTLLLELPFSLDGWRIIVVLLVAVAATMVVGLVTTWSALTARPAARLRGG